MLVLYIILEQDIDVHPKTERCSRRTCLLDRNWSIVLTGHSLGAGAAALVALYIRSFYPNSRCWAFEPPGGLVDGTLAEAAADCVTSVVLGKDWVPRLSLASFERLRDEMVRVASIFWE